MNQQYTAIYVESWMSGSHQHSLTKIKRIEVKEGETVVEVLEREQIKDTTVYLFVGWPKLQGE